MIGTRTGRIVWHDLFTGNRKRSMAFYQRLANWRYVTEHATDFAWGGGEKDYVLALSGDEAGAGLSETPPELTNGWIAYVEVGDVDAATADAETLGGTILRQPFDVPGVGRNALLRDPHGALIGLSLSRHDFPAPGRQFGVEIHLSDGPAFPAEFYAQLFGWKTVPAQTAKKVGTVISGPSGAPVAVHLVGEPPDGRHAVWMPSVKVAQRDAALRDAEKLGAMAIGRMTSTSAQQHYPLLCGPDGEAVCLQEA